MQKAAAPLRFPTLKSCCVGPVSHIKKLLRRSGFVCDLNTALCNVVVRATMAQWLERLATVTRIGVSSRAQFAFPT